MRKFRTIYNKWDMRRFRFIRHEGKRRRAKDRASWQWLAHQSGLIMTDVLKVCRSYDGTSEVVKAVECEYRDPVLSPLGLRPTIGRSVGGWCVTDQNTGYRIGLYADHPRDAIREARKAVQMIAQTRGVEYIKERMAEKRAEFEALKGARG